jgi:Necrosis inducing protein (NPP1)
MKNFKKIITQVTLLSLGLGLPTAAAVQPVMAAGVPHNSITPQATLPNKLSPLINNARPHFSFDDGCFPYPAADPQGNTNGGLNASGSPGGGCRDARFQQTYARQTTLDPKVFPGASTAVMYAQYFPKDQGNRQGSSFGFGHRHDWEEVVVFLDSNGNAIKAAVSGHGKYTAINRNQAEFWDGNRVKVSYGTGNAKNNSFRPSKKLGSSPPIVAWSTMTPAMQQAISNQNNWDNAGHRPSPKIINGVFQQKVTEAWQAPGF